VRLIPITPEQRMAHFADPSKCPFCGGDEWTASEETFVARGSDCTIEKTMNCERCGRLFTQKFTFADVLDAKETCGVCKQELTQEDNVEHDKKMGGFSHVACLVLQMQSMDATPRLNPI
jgi:hypothetical protein